MKSLLVVPVEPLPKPRMTQADRWKRRKCVVNYFLWKDKIKDLAKDFVLPEQYKVVFTVPMPKSWSKKKKDKMDGAPHQQRPDVDNLLKAWNDAFCVEDSHIWNVHAIKVWGKEGKIEVFSLEERSTPLVSLPSWYCSQHKE